MNLPWATVKMIINDLKRHEQYGNGIRQIEYLAYTL